ncbi:hypothetical protein L1987_51030 [Smallanthus sonchifolius]|uniref:Uncharacterized protein n=1 Tax=Smallanthus sonchifolius TaxID=185202 RepID=A0ACB9EQ96_9ASTR|nr:hypothetical protein L1987_51030 [Smallanthus sonchifolius]
MGSTAKRTTVSTGESWGMGFLLVFFPQDHHHHHHHHQQQQHTLLKRSNSSQILAKAQSIISVCALVIFFTLILFTLSTFEPNNASHHYRRHLSQSHPNLSKKALISPALQRLGTLYSRGTKSMNDLVLCHVPESATLTELKSFLRAFHMSGLLSKSDLLFIFPSITTPEFSDDVIREENQLFLKVIHRYKSELGNRSHVSDFPASFNVSQFVKSGKESNGEPVWGRRIKSGGNSNYSDVETELTRLSYGSVVGFGVGELDPENSLSGFLDHVPMSLRRWASYPMLLGRLRRNFKHVMLVDIKDVVLLGDPLARVRNASPESVFLSTKHNRKPAVNPAVIVGGSRGVRRLSAAMLTEIVRATTPHNKRKTLVTESTLLSRLAGNELVQKSFHVVVSTESIPEASSLGGVGIASFNKVVRRGNSNIDSELTKHICSFRIEASVYTECRKVQVQPF